MLVILLSPSHSQIPATVHVHKPHAQANISITATLYARVYARRLVPHSVSALSGPAVGQPHQAAPQAAHARERISVCARRATWPKKGMDMPDFSVCARRGDLAEEGLAGASLGVRAAAPLEQLVPRRPVRRAVPAPDNENIINGCFSCPYLFIARPVRRAVPGCARMLECLCAFAPQLSMYGPRKL